MFFVPKNQGALRLTAQPLPAPDQEVVPFRASKLTHLGLLTKQRDLGVELQDFRSTESWNCGSSVS